jgi:hypothetical protein
MFSPPRFQDMPYKLIDNARVRHGQQMPAVLNDDIRARQANGKGAIGVAVDLADGNEPTPHTRLPA